ncbi:MAG TPA: hypothetical protein VM432_01340 [Bdellovibrionales bacterium]|nr:hypothetical protein [Bdellovibrionales bacterium]
MANRNQNPNENSQNQNRNSASGTRSSQSNEQFGKQSTKIETDRTDRTDDRRSSRDIESDDMLGGRSGGGEAGTGGVSTNDVGDARSKERRDR